MCLPSTSIRTHTNDTHGIAEVQHTPLPNAVREKVGEKCGQDVNLSSILVSKLLYKPTFLTSKQELEVP